MVGSLSSPPRLSVGLLPAHSSYRSATHSLHFRRTCSTVCLFSISTRALASVSAVDAVKIGSQADFASPHLRDDRADCAGKILVHLQCFLMGCYTQGVEEASMFALFPEGVPIVLEGAVDDSLGRCEESAYSFVRILPGSSLGCFLCRLVRCFISRDASVCGYPLEIHLDA
jgi:hypothetical protein